MFKLSKAFLKKLVLVVLGLIAACQPFLVAVSVGYSLVVVHRLLIAAASLGAGHKVYCAQASVVAAHGLSSHSFQALEHRLSSCGS